MARPIDADILLERLNCPNIQIKGLGLETVIALKDIKNFINTAPTYEINDKKCSNCCYGYYDENCDYATCIKPHAGFSNTHKKDWFCADWKERDNVNG